MLLDVTLATAVIATDLVLILVISRSSVFDGLIGQAVGYLMIANAILLVVAVLMRAWLTCFVLVLAVALLFKLLGKG